MAGWMIDDSDPARLEIAERAKGLGITGSPDKPAHPLGKIALADGRVVNAHVVHAVDPIITDGASVVMIDRKNEPGKGKPALPGGFIDPMKGGVGSAVAGRGTRGDGGGRRRSREGRINVNRNPQYGPSLRCASGGE